MSQANRIVIDAFITRFRENKQMAEKAVAQVPDELLHRPLDENTNSIAVIMKHMGGNLRSRFTDFLTSDGEKPNRDRDSEFVDDISERQQLLAYWDQGWNCLLESLAALSDDDLQKTVTIRSQPHTVIDALARALAHAGYHVGQIVQLSRHWVTGDWKTLTIPRGGSQQFTDATRNKFAR